MTNNDYRPYVLEGDKVREYLREATYFNDKALSLNLSRTQSFSRGNVLAFLPFEMSDPDANHLDGIDPAIGGVAEYRKSVEILSRVIHCSLSLRKNRVCLLEDAWAKPGEKRSFKSCRTTLLGEQVYCLLLPDDPEEMVKNAIKESDSTQMLGVIMDTDEDMMVLDARKITKAAESARMVIASAFDGESFLIWENPNY